MSDVSLESNTISTQNSPSSRVEFKSPHSPAVDQKIEEDKNDERRGHAQTTTMTTATTLVTLSEPTGWWGSRDVHRPWWERNIIDRKRSVPTEHEDRWIRTRERVERALHSITGYTIAAAHDALEISADALYFAPIFGLGEAAHVLLTIWDSLQLVETNRLACLRLTERCASILFSVQSEVQEAGAGVENELHDPLVKLIEAFKTVHLFLQKQIHRPFLKRYLKRDEILRAIGACDAALSDALGLFSLSIQVRTLRQIQEAEARRQEDTERIIKSIIAVGSPDATPRQETVGLPAVTAAGPVYSLKGTSQGPTPLRGHSTSTSSGSAPSSGQQLQSPPPTPDEISNPSTTTRHILEASQPPDPCEVLSRIRALAAEQDARDSVLDAEDLRARMQEAISATDDVTVLNVLQVPKTGAPEAIKAMQRARERIEDKEREIVDAREALDDIGMPVRSSSESAADADLLRTTNGVKTRRSSRSVIPALRRRLTLDSRRGKASKGSTVSLTVGRSERDTLDREFIEAGIDALRRMSDGASLNLPDWTITRYEIDMETKIGVGFFSDVYRATWHHRTVAVKVLASTTPFRLFMHEMSVWKTLQHEHVLPLLGASAASGDPPWFFVSPYMRNGSLVAYLRTRQVHRDPVSATEMRDMVYEIARGMEYLHKQGVMHGDLKGTNVLIDDDKHCVISDFGQSEMKSEVYRISGISPPRGTLRWQAPEVIDGRGQGRLTQKVDVYAFAIVCVEIFTNGGLPWPMAEDETVRHLVLDEDRRPKFAVNEGNSDLVEVIEACWLRDPEERPSFPRVVREFRKRGLGERDVPPTSSSQITTIGRKKKSPNMKPGPLPNAVSEDVSKHGNLASTDDMHASTSRELFTGIPMQRIITPIKEEGKQGSPGASPVEYKPIKLPQPINESGKKGSEETTSSSTTATTTSSSKKTKSDHEGVEVQVLGAARSASPVPDDEAVLQRKNESRYRMCLRHDFHSSLVLPLWDPSSIQLGAVGYLSRPSGSFVTLLNAFNPQVSSNGRAKGMPSLEGYGKVVQGSQRQDRRNYTQRGLDIIQGLLWFRSRREGVFQQSVSRRYSFPLHAGQKASYLITEITTYRYIENLDTPKSWFAANIDRILQIYGNQHRLSKEDVYLIIGTLDTPDYGLFVNHNNPNGQVHFNVFAAPKNGEHWGAFSTDTEVHMNGPVYHEEVRGQHYSANKVSTVTMSSPRQLNTVLLARLRFKSDEEQPTSL